jgi:hypothetical protein
MARCFAPAEHRKPGPRYIHGVGEGLNWIRKAMIVGLTFLIAFLGTLVVVAAATKPEASTWMPLALGFLFYIALGLLKPFKAAVPRLAISAQFASGALSLWFISEPPAASEPNQRFTEYMLILCSVGPVLCALLLVLLVEERKKVPARAAGLVFIVILFGWAISFFSEWHSLAGLHHLAAASIRFISQIGNSHALPHRRLLQIGFFALSTIFVWILASSGGASRSRRLAVCAMIVGGFVLFDEFRLPFELSLPISKSSLSVDVIAVATAFGVCEVLAKARRPKAAS